MLRHRLVPYLVSIGYLASAALCISLPPAEGNGTSAKPGTEDVSVLILGGGVSGIIAARTLSENGITNFRIVEARDELGGRLHSIPFGAPGKQKIVEVIPSPPNQSPDSPMPSSSARTGSKGLVGGWIRGQRTQSGGSSRNTRCKPSTTRITKACVRLSTFPLLHGQSTHEKKYSHF